MAADPSLSAVVSSLTEKFKSDDAETNPFAGLERSTVLQECRVFHDPKTVTQSPRKCCQLITQLLFLLGQGEDFLDAETTEVFFGVTKLFQSKDVNLRRMVYLFIKEMAQATRADEVIIVTSSLMKDMNSTTDLYRGNALRVLSHIIDSSLLSQIERYIKQAIVDRNPMVASSALIAGITLARNRENTDILRRWASEVQEAVSSSNDMVQYHGLLLLHHIKKHDRHAVSKLVTRLHRGSLSSPLAVCLLIRYTTRMLRDSESSLSASARAGAMEFMSSCLKHSSEIVMYEAARSMCSLPDISHRDLSPAVTVLQLFLNSTYPARRFAAVRTLSKVAMTHPAYITKCNDDMEELIGDENRSIATLAITTLLKTGGEDSVDRLMKQIGSFMSEIGDEFKIVVIEAIHALCLKFPAKCRLLLSFLADVLREEGGFEFKRAIVNAILDLIDTIPDSKDLGLYLLCDFIEDCEFTPLQTRILHVIGQQGPTTRKPSRYIRFIYNRVILEQSEVRVAAVGALGQFGARLPALRGSIITLLKRVLYDEDDQVRDHATFCLDILSSDDAGSLLISALPMTMEELSRSVASYRLRPTPGEVTWDALPIVEASALPAAAGGGAASGGSSIGAPAAAGGGGGGAAGGAAGAAAADADETAAALYAIPEFADLGRLFRSSAPVLLTELETEYVVTCTKHIFDEHVVFQFDVKNTLDVAELRNLHVRMDPDDPDAWEQLHVLPAAAASCGTTASTYVCMLRKEGDDGPFAAASFTAELRFSFHEVDPDSGEAYDDGYEEDYPLEELEVVAADFMAKRAVPDFAAAWAEMEGHELVDKFSLSFTSLPKAVAAVIDFLGMQPCYDSASVPDGAKKHQIVLSGIFLGGHRVLVRALLQLELDGTVLKIGVRSPDEETRGVILSCIA
eukprot:PLAT5336.5.p1 GENE.PLAT5336.5~~PLAT5336.5.p1  ORF type:complete len:910 (+),score=521.07 PLAT5336.5:27-2756(+)